MFGYSRELEEKMLEAAGEIREFSELIKSAVYRSREPYTYNPWKFREHVFIVKLHDGVADYIYSSSMKYFRAPAATLLPMLIRAGNIVVIEERAIQGIDTYLVRKERVVKTLEQRLEEVRKERNQIEKKLVRSRSRWLKEICELYSKEEEQLKRAIEYLKS